MKEKYIVKEPNGWWYEGKYYIEDSVVELSKTEYSQLSAQVKLQAVSKK